MAVLCVGALADEITTDVLGVDKALEAADGLLDQACSTLSTNAACALVVVATRTFATVVVPPEPVVVVKLIAPGDTPLGSTPRAAASCSKSVASPPYALNCAGLICNVNALLSVVMETVPGAYGGGNGGCDGGGLGGGSGGSWNV